MRTCNLCDFILDQPLAVKKTGDYVTIFTSLHILMFSNHFLMGKLKLYWFKAELQIASKHTHFFRSRTLSCASALPCSDDFDMCFYGISWKRILYGYYDRDLPLSLIRSLVLFCIIPTCSTSIFIFLLVGSPRKSRECFIQSARSQANLIRFVHFIVSWVGEKASFLHNGSSPVAQLVEHCISIKWSWVRSKFSFA